MATPPPDCQEAISAAYPAGSPRQVHPAAEPQAAIPAENLHPALPAAEQQAAAPAAILHPVLPAESPVVLQAGLPLQVHPEETAARLVESRVHPEATQLAADQAENPGHQEAARPVVRPAVRPEAEKMAAEPQSVDHPAAIQAAGRTVVQPPAVRQAALPAAERMAAVLPAAQPVAGKMVAVLHRVERTVEAAGQMAAETLV